MKDVKNGVLQIRTEPDIWELFKAVAKLAV